MGIQFVRPSHDVKCNSSTQLTSTFFAIAPRSQLHKPVGFFTINHFARRRFRRRRVPSTRRQHRVADFHTRTTPRITTYRSPPNNRRRQPLPVTATPARPASGCHNAGSSEWLQPGLPLPCLRASGPARSAPATTAGTPPAAPHGSGWPKARNAGPSRIPSAIHAG